MEDLGIWVIAGTPVAETYPCRCERWKCQRVTLCPCAGRDWTVGPEGGADAPPWCCSRVNTLEVVQAHQEAERRAYAVRQLTGGVVA